MSTSCSIRRTEELTSPAKMGPLVCLANSLAKFAAFSPLRICREEEGGRDSSLMPLLTARFSTPAQNNRRANLLGYLVDPVGGTVAEIGALGVPGPAGKHT